MTDRGQRPRTRGGRTGIPRAIVRRNIFDQTVDPAPSTSTTTAQGSTAPSQALVPRPPSPSSSEYSFDSDDDSDGAAPVPILRVVAEPTHGGELVKRARAHLSSGSSEQEDKRVKLTSFRTASQETPLSPSPEAPPRREVLPPLPAPLPQRESSRRSSRTYPPASGVSSSSRSADTGGLDSTSYARIVSPDRMETGSPSTSYAAAAAEPPRSPPPASRQPAQPAATEPNRSPPAATTQPPPPAATAPSAPDQRSGPRRSYPPIVVECLPNWPTHTRAIRDLLGYTANARAFGKGIRFMPQSDEEFRVVQRYLSEAAAQDSRIAWHCYSMPADKPSKVAIRGLLPDTPTDTIIAALRDLGFPAETARALPPPRGRRGCTYYVRLAHMSPTELRDIYALNTLLDLPDIRVEGWKGGNRPPQCFRCQAYWHSSFRCFRPVRCVRCAGPHMVRDCTRPRDVAPTCANCEGAHAANDRICTVFRREARKKGLSVPAPPPPPHPAPAPSAQQQRRAPPPPAASAQRSRAQAAPQRGAQPPPAARRPPQTARSAPQAAPQAAEAQQPTTLTAPANAPTARGRALRGGRRRRNRAPRPAREEPAAASTPQQRPQAAAAPPPPSEPAVQRRPAAPATTEDTNRRRVPPRRRQAPLERRADTQRATRGAPPSPQEQTLPPTSFEVILQLVVEAITSGVTAYLQGQDALTSIYKGLSVLARFRPPAGAS